MTLSAQDIVDAIGQGVAQALNTNQLFLGVEEGAFRNADIHPEYVTTVEVAKSLTAPARTISLETHMKELRRHARSLALIRDRSKTAITNVDAHLARYRFGKRDSQRLDIVVRPANSLEPPLLIAEAKLGISNLSGVIQDIERVCRLLMMYNDLQLLTCSNIYGAAVFHYMEEENDTGILKAKVQGLVTDINAHLQRLTGSKAWLNARVGMLTQGSRVQPVTGYTEVHDDGSEEDVFAKKSFTFAPGLVLLGNAVDVSSVAF